MASREVGAGWGGVSEGRVLVSAGSAGGLGAFRG